MFVYQRFATYALASNFCGRSGAGELILSKAINHANPKQFCRNRGTAIKCIVDYVTLWRVRTLQGRAEPEGVLLASLQSHMKLRFNGLLRTTN